MERQFIQPLKADCKVALHGSMAIEGFLDAALAILERTGARYQSEKVLQILEEHGARVNHASGVARMLPELVLSAIASAPRSMVLHSRDGSCDLDLSSGNTFGGPGGCGTEVLDWVTGKRRPSTKEDVAAITRMLDYLGSIQFWWPTVGAGDCGETAPLHEIDAGWRNTVKHLQAMVNGERQARFAVEMATVVAGSREALRSRPLLSNLTTVVTPLVNDRDSIEASLVFAEAGIPICFAVQAAVGTTAPATLSGTYALALADLLSAVVPIELATPGAPVLGSLTHIYSDPRSGTVMTAPLNQAGLLLGTQLVHRIGISSLGTFAGTDALLPGTWQAGVETTQSLMLAAIDGCELYSGIGLTNTYRLFSGENLMLDDDLYHRARQAFLGVPVDAEALAIDVIDAVGPGGHFLGARHTRRHVRDSVMRAITQEIDADGHYRDPLTVAKERAEKVMRDYRPEPLAEDKQAELTRILAAADLEIRGLAW